MPFVGDEKHTFYLIACQKFETHLKCVGIIGVVFLIISKIHLARDAEYICTYVRLLYMVGDSSFFMIHTFTQIQHTLVLYGYGN